MPQGQPTQPQQPPPQQQQAPGMPQISGEPYKGGQPEQDDQEAYRKWQQIRESEIQAEQMAANGAAGGAEMRWGAREQRQGKVRLWLPEEAVRMGKDGPELKTPAEVYGKYIFDWAAVLNGPDSRKLAEATRDLSDTGAYRVQAVSMSPDAARTAERYECIISLQATTEQRERLQKLLGRMDLREMRETEFQTLEQALKAWAGKHGRPVQYEVPDVSMQVRAMTRMLQDMGLTDKQIRMRMEAHLTGKGGPEAQQKTEDVQMTMSSASSTEIADERRGDADNTVAWHPPSDGGTYTGTHHVTATTWEGDSGRTRPDSYLEGVSIGDADMEEDSDDGVRPMTNEELQEIWRKDGERKQTAWKKGLGRNADKEGDWDVYNAETQRPTSSKIHETRGNAKKAERGKKGEDALDAKKTSTKQTRSSKGISSGERDRNQQPPRGGRKE